MQLRFTLFATFVLVSALATTAPAAFSTGFEEPTYVSAQLSGQDSWTGSTPATVRVRTASEISDELTASGRTVGDPVRSGNQAVLVTGTAGSSSTFRPITDLATESRVVLDVWARPLSPVGTTEQSTVGSNAGNIFMTMEDGAGIRATAFRFGVTETSTTIDFATAEQPGLWRPSGTAWAPDAWYNLTMDADYTTKTYDFFIDGTQVNADPIPFYDARSANLSQARIFRGSGQAGMIVDDLSVTAVPEPTGMACLLLAGGAMFLRRRSARA